jgi:hypothetical protein
MSTKLTANNRYLRDSSTRERMVLRSVASSSAIEGVHAPFKSGSALSGALIPKAPAKKPRR